MSIGSFILSLFGIRTITQAKIPVPDEPYVEFDPAYFTVTPDPANQRNIVTGGSGTAPAFGPVTAPSYSITGQTLPFLGPRYTLTTTDNTAHTVTSIPVPAAGSVDVELRIIPNLGTGPNANHSPPSFFRFYASASRQGSGAPVVDAQDFASVPSVPFVSTQTSGSGPGSPNVAASGNNLLIQVIGFAIKEAWTSGHTYINGNGSSTPGDFVTSSGGVWLCVTPGTASGSAPTGTGTGQGTGAVFDYVGPASGSQVTVNWTVVITGLVTG